MAKKLPNKFSDLIEVALGDLKAVERSKQYRIGMNQDWHSPVHRDDGEEQYCIVCFAGAVMAKTLGIADEENVTPSDFTDQDTQNKLKALDDLREGDITCAFQRMEKGKPAGLAGGFPVTSYDDNPVKFKKDMKRLAEILRFFKE